uniref:Uncharacterized protein n=1 Tax=Candidatus Kentrum sp. FW TaxID=2126338 RepID=A0A450SMZ3_9GAMM|nr:MAG: hypothetical protein BECKFW1821A_GA0114235_105217 [Candidatus Kentron sp. FW]
MGRVRLKSRQGHPCLVVENEPRRGSEFERHPALDPGLGNDGRIRHPRQEQGKLRFGQGQFPSGQGHGNGGRFLATDPRRRFLPPPAPTGSLPQGLAQCQARTLAHHRDGKGQRFPIGRGHFET